MGVMFTSFSVRLLISLIKEFGENQAREYAKKHNLETAFKIAMIVIAVAIAF